VAGEYRYGGEGELGVVVVWLLFFSSSFSASEDVFCYLTN
jgi:hypothetical protein